MSGSDSDNVDLSVEMTLEDTYELLKDLKNERVQEIKELINIVRNNEVRTIEPNITPEEIRLRRLQFVQSMEKLVAKEQPIDLPIGNISSTVDYFRDALNALEEEVNSMNNLIDITREENKELKNDIAYLERKKDAFEQMKKASLTAAENEVSVNYEEELIVAKELFQEVKKDLQIVVETLFPDNQGFQELLCDLARALTKGGDDQYIEVDLNTIDFVQFLDEADIIQFHPHDKYLIKLQNM